LEGGGHGFSQGTNLVSAWKNDENYEKSQSGEQVPWSRFEL
jgi:hypothetical protein